ncbi:MAG: hypothetical protein ABSG08_18165 [Terriglobales bacterium]|jgi:hypothetical protein
MLGLNRTGNYSRGFATDVNELVYGNIIDWMPSSAHFGTPLTIPTNFGSLVFLPLNLGNSIDWQTFGG